MDEQIWQIISSKLNNEKLSEADEQILDNWLNSSSENLAIYTKFNDFVKSQLACMDVDTNKAYKLVSARIAKNKRKNIFRKISIATSVAASILLAVFLIPKDKKNSTDSFACSNNITISDSSNIHLLYKDQAIILSDSKDTSFIDLPYFQAFTVGKKKIGRAHI